MSNIQLLIGNLLNFLRKSSRLLRILFIFSSDAATAIEEEKHPDQSTAGASYCSWITEYASTIGTMDSLEAGSFNASTSASTTLERKMKYNDHNYCRRPGRTRRVEYMVNSFSKPKTSVKDASTSPMSQTLLNETTLTVVSSLSKHRRMNFDADSLSDLKGKLKNPVHRLYYVFHFVFFLISAVDTQLLAGAPLRDRTATLSSRDSNSLDTTSPRYNFQSPKPLGK